MARWNRDSTRAVTCLFEAAAWHYAIKPVCACGHSATFDPHGLWWKFEQNAWDDRLSAVKARFYCQICSRPIGKRVRPRTLETVRASKVDVTLTLPDEYAWKRAVSRFRG